MTKKGEYGETRRKVLELHAQGVPQNQIKQVVRVSRQRVSEIIKNKDKPKAKRGRKKLAPNQKKEPRTTFVAFLSREMLDSIADEAKRTEHNLSSLVRHKIKAKLGSGFVPEKPPQFYRLGISMPKELRDEIVSIAKDNGISTCELVRQLLESE